VGNGITPGSTGRHDGGLAGDLDALAEFGRGAVDPATGLHEYYEIPDGHQAHATPKGGAPVSWKEISQQFTVVLADFASEYGIRLMTTRMSWPEFAALVAGLFGADTRLRRYFAPADQAEDTQDETSSPTEGD
jgi:hypothetical protein